MTTDSFCGTTSKQKLIVCIPLWGHEYIQQWLKWSWASLCSRRNLPAVAEHYHVVIQIVTQPFNHDEILEGIRESPLFGIVDIQILPLLDPSTGDKYSIMTSAVLISMGAAVESRAAFIFSGADLIWADGSLQYLATQLQTMRTVFTWSGILERDGATHALEEFRKGNVLQVEPRELVKVTLEHSHALQESWFVLENSVPANPWCAIWKSPHSDCAVIRAHAPTPVGVNFDKFNQAEVDIYFKHLANFVLDSAETFEPLIGEFADTLFVSDSDNLLVVSLDDSSRGMSPSRVPCLPSERDQKFLMHLAKYQRFHNNISKFLFTKFYILHVNELDGWEVKQVSLTQHQICYQMASKIKIDLIAQLWFSLSLRWRMRVSSVLFFVKSCIRLINRCSEKIIIYTQKRLIK
jgi:hypothetical protein